MFQATDSLNCSSSTCQQLVEMDLGCNCEYVFFYNTCSCSQRLSSHFYCITDIDECENNDLHNCHKDASCTNTDGSFNCSCNGGYSESGTECTGKSVATSLY